MYDWSSVSAPGPRFENLVASNLLKYCHFIEDTEGYEMELRYVRDVEGREIDFVVLKDKNALCAVEVKTGEGMLSKHITYFRQRTSTPAFYQVHLGEPDYGAASEGRVMPFWKFCKEVLRVWWCTIATTKLYGGQKRILRRSVS